MNVRHSSKKRWLLLSVLLACIAGWWLSATRRTVRKRLALPSGLSLLGVSVRRRALSEKEVQLLRSLRAVMDEEAPSGPQLLDTMPIAAALLVAANLSEADVERYLGTTDLTPVFRIPRRGPWRPMACTALLWSGTS